MILINYDNTIGAGFLSCMISAVLFGITVTQGVHYLQTFKSDGWLTTTVVIILLIADVSHTVLTTQATFVYLIKGVEDIRQLENVPWSLTSSTALAVFSAVLLHAQDLVLEQSQLYCGSVTDGSRPFYSRHRNLHNSQNDIRARIQSHFECIVGGLYSVWIRYPLRFLHRRSLLLLPIHGSHGLSTHDIGHQ